MQQPEPISLDLIFSSAVTATAVAAVVNKEPVGTADGFEINLTLHAGEGVDVPSPIGMFGFFLSETKGSVIVKVPTAIAAVIPKFPHRRSFQELRPLRTCFEIDVSPGIPASIEVSLLGRISVRLR